jgi:ketosteroid isomerase-like protein
MRLSPLLLGAALVGAACASQPKAVAPPVSECAPNDSAAPVQVIRDMYTALQVDDASAVRRLFTPDFYVFDVGKRFTGPELFALIKRLHADGETFVWEVLPPETHLSCNVAWLTWENRGSITSDGVATAVSWLESAVLHWSGDAWRMAFFHSTRMPAPPSSGG